MSMFHYPGMVLTLLFLAFLGGIWAFSLRLPHALWRLAVALVRHGRRLANHLGRGAGQVLTATWQRARNLPRPFARPALRVTLPFSPWCPRFRLVVLIADPLARHARADQLHNALADLLRARTCPLPATITVEVASEARRRGVAYVAYLDRGQATGAYRIRLAAFAPGGKTIGVDAQHTHLADLLQHLDDDPAVTFVGLPTADPSSPIVGDPPMPPVPVARQPEAVRHGGASTGPPSTPPPAPPSPVGGVRNSPVRLAHPQPAPVVPPGDADVDIPYGDHDAPAA